ncbi:hypothetical protein P280DRAFT_390637 [Massarina eburnea CBS 473.64]|uniref:Uncharacterized protein n=1 Tax=Massarina eburnea CBS 473.64 TaxID=1395130 RepID=A0A6A6SBK6_9PLEO|nr:hypothetical protein P280DRAFT_390637 [Massarina eburnea CBS 473.64]
MSPAHICIRGALTQAFRPSTSRVAAPGTVTIPAFLVPAVAVARSPRRPFSSARRRRAEQPHQLNDASHPKPHAPSIFSKIPYPDKHDRGNVQAWLAAIDPFLPVLLRQVPSDDPDISVSVTPLDFAQVINVAQNASVDILSHVGLVEQRWDAVVWMAKKLTEHGKTSTEPPTQLEPFANILWSDNESRSLKELTENALYAERAEWSRKLKHTLDDLTSIPDTINPIYRATKQAVGQLWRSLAKMILAAVEGDSAEYDAIMAHVLEIIAHLHHVGFMPESVYTHRSNPDMHALQQPPTLHLLSTQILTALSDASWAAHEASARLATERRNASYFLGHEIPGSRYKVKVTGISPELWLELILWSCLHGGWLLDGSAILEQMISPQRERVWRLMSWRELLQAKELESARNTGWGLFQTREDASEQAEDRARTERTISSEVVTAFVDGLVNNMRLGVGARGIPPEDIVERIKNLKRFLDANQLSLGSTTWDTIMSRILESGGIVIEKRPELLLSILDLASAFGSEVSAVNAPSRTELEQSEPPYFYEPTTIPLNLLHQTMRSFIHNGDIKGAMTTLKMLQEFTDSNKQKSLEQFFKALKTVQLHHDDPFTNRLPPIEFPAFDTQLSATLLAKLLDLATVSKMYDLGRYFLFSEDLDGPLIDPSMYGSWAIAASIIRFGTMAGEDDLVLKIVEQTGTWNDNSQTYRMPYEFLTALLSSQMKLHRWKSVRGIQEYVLQSPGYKVEAEILATLGAELLRSPTDTNGEGPSERSQVCQAFTDFLFTWESLVLTDLRNELYCVLAVVSTISEEWGEFCSQFLAFSARQGIKLSTDNFNLLLSGILDGYGSNKGRHAVDMWCYTPPRTFEPYRAPGGLPKMSQFRPSKGEEYEGRPPNIEIVQPSGAKLILVGRVHPNRQTVWAILRKVQQEVDERGQQQGEIDEVRSTLKWAARLLYYLGFDYEDIVRDLGTLTDLADLESPPARAVLGLDAGGGESESEGASSPLL